MRITTDFTDQQAELRSARLIQQGLLPKKRHFDRLFKDFFVFYKPKNIISGDFYWVGQKNGLRYVVVGDCTGHGVSAALLSVLAINLFEYVIMNKGLRKVSNILKEVDRRFIESFKNNTELNFDNPWIDLSVVCVDRENKKLFFAGANRKMLFLNNGLTPELVQGKRYPIGGWQFEEERNFPPVILSYKEGDIIYLGSDGFQDQIGGWSNKKYKSKRLHDFLKANSQLDFTTQRNKLEEEFLDWKGMNDQIDDVCLIGLKL